MCHYLLRPPLAQERIEILADGRVGLTLAHPWADGTRALVFTPVEFLEKLAVLIPKPRINLVVYHGVLAPRARHRAAALGAMPPPTSDGGARAVVVGGRGRAFCTGIDLAALAADRLGADWFRRWEVALAKIEAIPVATVAAIQGACLGGGLQITLCCDLRVASDDATFGLSAVRHGIIPGLAPYRLPRLIGMGAAREMMLLGETWDAALARTAS